MPGTGRQFPPFVAPMLATPAPELPADADQWTAEVKWDGMRAIAAVAGGQVRIWSRAGRDVTAAYPELAALETAARRRTLLLDAEVVALSGARPDFTRLQHRMLTGRPSVPLLTAVPVTLIVFDLLRIGARSLLHNPHAQRRALLDDLGLQVPGAIQVPPAFPGDAAALLRASREQGYEGIILKRPGSFYTPGRRSASWMKIRNIRAADVLVGGWLPGAGQRARLPGSLLVGLPGKAGLEYAGSVGTGFTQAALRELASLLSDLEQPVSPFADALPPSIARHARWVRPALAAEVAYLERTPSGRLRQPVWRGLRSS
ncbi:MAG: putative ligase [Actinomycetia bacterium]|nr:putative ligase [Actinomycetes bacterium]